MPVSAVNAVSPMMPVSNDWTSGRDGPGVRPNRCETALYRYRSSLWSSRPKPPPKACVAPAANPCGRSARRRWSTPRSGRPSGSAGSTEIRGRIPCDRPNSICPRGWTGCHRPRPRRSITFDRPCRRRRRFRGHCPPPVMRHRCRRREWTTARSPRRRRRWSPRRRDTPPRWRRRGSVVNHHRAFNSPVSRSRTRRSE